MKVFGSLLLVAAADPTCTQRATSSCQFADGQTIQLTQVYCGALEEVHITGGLEIFGQEIFGQRWKYSDSVGNIRTTFCS